MTVTVGRWKQLADILITTDELDPVYPFAAKLYEKCGAAFVDRFLLTFFMFYDLKGAIDVAENTDNSSFWGYIKHHYDKLPRGRERRHSRGALGVTFVENLSRKGPPHAIWDSLYAPTYSDLVKNVTKNFQGCGIGPYFTWKLMDFFDRILGYAVRLDLDEAIRWLPPEPKEASKLSGVRLQEVAEYIGNQRKYLAPGLPNRQAGLPEAETVLCAIKGYWFSYSYDIGDDLKRRHKELEHYPDYLELLPPKLGESYVRVDYMGA